MVTRATIYDWNNGGTILLDRLSIGTITGGDVSTGNPQYKAEVFHSDGVTSRGWIQLYT